jgi:hypothetical protein
MQKIEATFNTLKDDGKTPDGNTVVVTCGDVHEINPATPADTAFAFKCSRPDFILSKEDATLLWVLMDDVTTTAA